VIISIFQRIVRFAQAIRKESEKMSGDFNKEKARLRELYKRYKTGLIKSEQISDKDADLLRKYYGVK